MRGWRCTPKEFLDYLATAWDRWGELPERGPEVWPNTFPYWSGRPEDPARPPCPAESIVARTGWYLGDLSVSLGPHTWTSIRRSSDTAVAAADAVLAGEPSAYALCRPSGHHARADRASGFCFVNNTAVGGGTVAHALRARGVLDVDAHHGDGTQQIFYDRDGRADHLGARRSHATTIRSSPATWTNGARATAAASTSTCRSRTAHGADAMYAAVDTRAARASAPTPPSALVVALGFDAHARDPIGVLRLESADFAGIGARVRALGLPTVVVQEGGYAIADIGDCLAAFLTGFAGGETPAM